MCRVNRDRKRGDSLDLGVGVEQLKKYDKQSEGKSQSPENICFRNMMTELEKEMEKGHMFTLKTVWDHYSKLLFQDFGIDAGVYKRYNFKQRVELYFGSDKVTFVQPLDVTKPLMIVPYVFSDVAMRTVLNDDLSEEEERSEEDGTRQYSLTHHEDEIFSWIFRVAVKIHSDLKHTPGHDIIGGLATDNAEKIVPESLYMLINLLCGSDNTEKMNGDDKDEAEIKNKVLSICQDIVFVASRGRKMTPKHLGLGFALHQATRSKQSGHFRKTSANRNFRKFRKSELVCGSALRIPGPTATEGTNSTRLSNKMGKGLESWCLEKQRSKVLEQAMFPALSRAAWVDVFVKYNTAIPSSAAVERLFSQGADIMKAKRASLTSDNFERLIFMKGNMDLLKMELSPEDSE
ncbi:hypothetical protein GWK47_038035 [Chionoecetes opilio]|uniref:HAT C-terminal dimerisation domain-containing protein n=1 Tax=Chionoecetes opilio TaxID=41210 RepID=A0A8J5CMC0_CHIOP|nr:hypothetical protein GWK47_038035 [Chionoecetes opilio]